MRFYLLMLVVSGAVAAAIAQGVSAEERVSTAIFDRQPSRDDLVCPQTLLRGCCSAYCTKPLPNLPRWCYCPGPCDYCRKSVPCVPCYHNSNCCDDYCCKLCPDVCRPLSAHYFTCAVGSGDCECSNTGLQRSGRATNATVETTADDDRESPAAQR